jgi:hypothetical protein
MLAGVTALMLSGCSASARGTYDCTGIPGLSRIELHADGSYVSEGDMLGHEASGAGTYTADAKRLRLSGTDSVEGLSASNPTSMEFEREENGDLKWIVSTCKRL